MEEELKFITTEQRKKLNAVLFVVKSVCDEITGDHEEYFLLRSIIGDLKKAILCQENYS